MPSAAGSRVLRTTFAPDAFSHQSIAPTFVQADLDEAYERGVTDGRLWADEQLRIALDRCAGAIANTSQALSAQLAHSGEAITETAIELALEAGAWLARRELRDADAFAARVREALGGHEPMVTIFVPADVAAALETRFANHKVCADPDLHDGDFRIVTAEGEVDGRLGGAIARLKAALQDVCEKDSGV